MQSHLLTNFLAKPFLKVIAGIENRNLTKVLEITEAAKYCNAEALDICDDPQIITEVVKSLKESSTRLFVSSLEASKLIAAEKLGADILELGNYDHLYPQGIKISAQEIINEAKQVLKEVTSPLCVTVPGYLSANEQANLAQDLNDLGVQIIQTEGGSISSATENGAIGQIEKAKVTLANTIELKKACPRTVIMAAGGLSNITLPLAIAAGANGVGVGKAISKLSSKIEMVATIKTLQNAIRSQLVTA